MRKEGLDRNFNYFNCIQVYFPKITFSLETGEEN